MDDSDYITELSGPVERIDGKLVLRIPLEAGGEHLIDCARGISRVVGDRLEVYIPDWLAEKLGLWEGTIVNVDNRDGKFNLSAVPEPHN